MGGDPKLSPHSTVEWDPDDTEPHSTVEWDLDDLTRTVRTNIHICGCGCWVWTGSVDTHGYAKVKMRNRTIVCHRYVYEHYLGELGDLTVDHLCDRHRNCLNPAHFEAVPLSENSIRANQRRFHDAPPDRSMCDDPTPDAEEPRQPEG